MATKTLFNSTKETVGFHEFANILLDHNTGQRSLHVTRPFQPGDIIADFYAGTTQQHATYLTVQTGTHTHITLQPEFLQYINHSCNPNVFFDTTTMKLICIKPLHAGDELFFFYPSTEWNMVQPFVCNCGNSDCLQLINGAAHLSNETLKKYKLTDFIHQQVKHKNAQ